MGVLLQPVIANDLPEIAPRNDARVKIRQPQLYSRLRHALLSAYGSRWAERNLVMFTVYIDDSGTDPKQAVAVAAALIVPAIQIPKLEKNWAAFASKYGFPDFHASECVARNPHSAFAGWRDDEDRMPVKRGLVASPGQHRYSSFNHDATGIRGGFEIESEGTARLRGPLIAKPR